MEISTGDLEALEATKRATIENEPTMSLSNEDFEALKVTRQTTIEIEPTMPKSSKDFEATTQATTQAINGNCELLGFLALCLLLSILRCGFPFASLCWFLDCS